jgi:hypothetical protein
MMPLFVLIPFGLVAAIFYAQLRVKNRLIDIAPQLWLDMERKSFWPQSAIQRLVFSDRHKTIGDSNLTNSVMIYRFATVGFVAIWLLLVLSAVFGLQPAKP